MNFIRDNVRRVNDRIAAALERAGRGGERITVVGITKTFGPDMVDAVVEAGIGDIGENRIQEFLSKKDQVTRACRWHLVGPLQRNKATKAIGQFDCIQSVDSIKLAQTLDRLGSERGITTRVYMQVNTSSEASKHGFTVEESADRAAEIAALPHVDLAGLMTIGPTSTDPAETRSCFQRLFRLRETINVTMDRPLSELSMGMSGDFESALEEGATVIRLGRVLTGERTR